MRRDEILNVAQELLQTEGYRAFSFRDLAARIGIKSASVHYYFPTKDALALALLERYHAQMLANLTGLAACSPAQRIAAYCEVFIQTFQDGRRICPGASFTADYEALPPAVQERLSDFYRENTRWLEETIRAGGACGEFRCFADPGLVASAVFCALEGAILMGRVSDGQSLQHMREWVLDSLRR
jgi:TetR/AcrR family transcriptional repressor of nem operon